MPISKTQDAFLGYERKKYIGTFIEFTIRI
jgi:hypothetical protein